MNSTILKRQHATRRRQPSTSTTCSFLSSFSSLSKSKGKAIPQLQIITEDLEDLFDSPRPSFSSCKSTPDKRRPKLSDIRLPKCHSEEDILSSGSMLSVPRPAPRPPTPGSSSTHLSSRAASPASFTRSPSPLTRSTTPSPDALHLSFQFPSPPPSTSPFSSPSSVSSGLPITPEQSPVSSPRFGPPVCSLRRLQTIKPLTIVKRNDLTFDTFFQEEDEVALEPISFASPTSPNVRKASCDPFAIIPSPATHSEEEEEFYTFSVSSLLTLNSAMPQKHTLHPRPESILPPPRRVSKPLPDTPDETRKTCFPSAQLDPAWSRRSFLIPTRPPPPPPARKARPPSLTLTKPLPRASVVPLDEGDDDDGCSVFSFDGISPFGDSDYLATDCSSEGSSDGLGFEFGVDDDDDLGLPPSLPGTPVPFTPVEEESQSPPVLRSRWSTSTFSSERSPQSSAVSKLKFYLRGNNSSRRKRGVVVVGPSATTSRKRTSLYSLSKTAKSPSSTISSFSFDTPLASPIATTMKLSPAALKRLGVEAAPPAALRRLGVEKVSLMSDSEEEDGVRRKPIPVEMFLRV